MTTQLKAYKFRIYPTKDQAQKLDQTFGCVRFIWNKCVENFNNYGKEEYLDKLTYKMIKDIPDNEFLNTVSAAALQCAELNFKEFKKQFFNKKRKTKLGRPNFKNKRSRQSYSLDKIRFELLKNDSLIRIEKIGKVKIQLSRDIPETTEYRSCTLSKTPLGEYYASILVKEEIEVKKPTGKYVGIDLGLKDLFILSDRQSIDNPRWFRENQTKLKKAQRNLSRKTKGSNRYNKQRLKVAKVYNCIVNQRNYFLHNISTTLVNNYDIICIEDLNVKGMMRNHYLAKSIQDASWSTFTSMLEYKCRWYGKSLVKIDRFYPSSKACSNCDYKLETLSLSVREWKCPKCNVIHERDLNAAKNILKEGYKNLTSAEYVDYERGEAVSLFDVNHHLASSVKRLETDFKEIIFN